uniref:protein-tyrosine-phosphatase n=1 Tax=Chromera velia CCMP2878 TaxID=1169474 RepID=A0A0G4F0M4_9ALVE|eukprot:Cvel_14599.t1-p1 / transcript=Cvel_14599.t1 / gene=Cvel_14599 / organism=Chromera_velia_CCMP2878 / gene_product=Dual specificity protein phosphatase CDC14A, putative / transcript_product=Dual specificity protein phosphatase CDC14A, putative / location=Cvel_scaffold1044:8169-11093(+) / protein_length=207 / sequence_SO=supercontig / SO=protein_coding / is_pseudo=false
MFVRSFVRSFSSPLSLHPGPPFYGVLDVRADEDGKPTYTPEDSHYVPVFKKLGVTLLVRLNEKQHDGDMFTRDGIKHVDLYFDGPCPSREFIQKFLGIVENEPGAVAVHCKAGLGMTGTLIGAFAMKHFQFPAAYCIGWNRICRPGSVVGPQQHFMFEIQDELFQSGASESRPPLPNAEHSKEQPTGHDDSERRRTKNFQSERGEQT